VRDFRIRAIGPRSPGHCRAGVQRPEPNSITAPIETIIETRSSPPGSIIEKTTEKSIE
jgi:hypothetical protein